MGGVYKRNLNIIQHPLTTTCGQHVIFYIFQRCKNETMEQIMSCYNERNILLNDVEITRMVNKNFQLDLKIIDIGFLETLD